MDSKQKGDEILANMDPDLAKNVKVSWEYEYHDRLDPTVAFFYTPHNVTLVSDNLSNNINNNNLAVYYDWCFSLLCLIPQG